MTSLKERYQEIHEDQEILLNKNENLMAKKAVACCSENTYLSLMFIVPGKVIYHLTFS